MGPAMVIYLSIKLIDQVVAELSAAYGPETPAVVAYRVSWPDQQLIRGTLADIGAKVKQAGIERQALILVGPALAARQGALKAVSKLYDKTFSPRIPWLGWITSRFDSVISRTIYVYC